MKNFLAAILGLGSFFTLEASQVGNAVAIQPLEASSSQGQVLLAVEHHRYWGTIYNKNYNHVDGVYNSPTLPFTSTILSAPYNCGGKLSCSNDFKLFKDK